MTALLKTLRAAIVALPLMLLAGCDDPHVYGSVGISSGYGAYRGGYGYGGYGYGGPRVHTSIAIGGRIR